MNEFFKTTRIAVVLTATAALAACGGSSVVPAGTAANSAPSAAHVGACIQPAKSWLFDGACKGISLYDRAVTIELPKYHRRWLILNFPTPKSVGNPSPFGVADATGNGDIQSNKGKAFPPYNGDYSKALVYIKLFNNGKTQIDYSVTPKITFTYKVRNLTGSTCAFAVFLGGKTGWVDTALPTGVQRHGVVIESGAVGGVSIPPNGALYTAIACK